MEPTNMHDRIRVAQLLEIAAQEEAAIEELERATRALWLARNAKLRESGLSPAARTAHPLAE